MSHSERYSVLFEPVTIGPVTAKNRFFQVPHCCAFGHIKPRGQAAMREMKARGGWAVVSTEEAEIHPSSDLSPYAEQRIWDQRDIPALSLITDAVHKHDSLAAIELVHNGHTTANLYTRIAPLAPVSMTVSPLVPRQARAMDKSDISALRRWHRTAVRNSIEAGFDIVYVYAGHYMTIAHHFLSPVLNQRSDEYGGSLENRVRLTRELLEDAREEADGKCAVALRLAVDDMAGSDGMQAQEEGRAIVEMLAEIPDLWDVNVAGWENDSLTSRFEPMEGYQESYTAFVKDMTSKPVVGVGRYTSPDRMASLVKRGVLDFIGAARPSIADPFLPNKVREDRVEDIRECIGCNICVASDGQGVPIRCTQNPTMGEEWRRNWHPEEIEPRIREDSVLVIGAGPAGLEAAMQLGKRGYEVTLAEASGQTGGRVVREAGLNGLGAWKRVHDYRMSRLEQMANVDIYLESPMETEEVLETDIPHVFVATGAKWRRDGVGRTSRYPIQYSGDIVVLTPDDIMDGTLPAPGSVVIYDDEQGYMAGVLAEQLAQTHNDITFVTSGGVVSAWTSFTLEQSRIQTRLIEKGVKIVTNRKITAARSGGVKSACLFGGEDQDYPADTFVVVTEKSAASELASRLRKEAENNSAIVTLEVLGDALAPGLIADAVYSGHLAARNFQRDPAVVDAELYLRELPGLEHDMRQQIPGVSGQN